MTELRRVSGPGSGFDRHVGRIIALVVTAIVIAIVKPWGGPAAPAAVVPPPPPPTASPTAVPSDRPDVFDFLTFGTNEPPPGWEIWPAGNLASFHFAMRIELSATGAASATAIPIETPAGSRGLGEVPSSWPTIRIPVGSFLDLIGLNSPIGYTVPSATLSRLDAVVSVPTMAVIGRSPWPDHFAVIGFAAAGGGASMQAWPAGHYRLDVVIEPGHLIRTVEVVIEGPGPSPSPTTASAAPGS
jgi:hypothetical protein